MSDFSGGFVVERVDAEIAPIVYESVRAYLSRIGERLEGRSVAYATELRARWLAIVVDGGPGAGKGRAVWPDANAAFAGELARALECRAWAWGEENQSGSEFVVAFSKDGKAIRDVRASWDDRDAADDPLAELARELGSLPHDDELTWAVQPLDRPFEPALLSEYLLAFQTPRHQPSPDRMTFSVVLTQSILVDAAKLAAVADTDLGSVFAAAWDRAKARLAEATPSADGSHLTFEATPPEPLAVASAPPELGARAASTPDLVKLNPPKKTVREIRELAIHADVKYGLVLDRAYLLARDRLWRGER